MLNAGATWRRNHEEPSQRPKSSIAAACEEKARGILQHCERPSVEKRGKTGCSRGQHPVLPQALLVHQMFTDITAHVEERPVAPHTPDDGTVFSGHSLK